VVVVAVGVAVVVAIENLALIALGFQEGIK
jgi:hypothetical protein